MPSERINQRIPRRNLNERIVDSGRHRFGEAIERMEQERIEEIRTIAREEVKLIFDKLNEKLNVFIIAVGKDLVENHNCMHAHFEQLDQKITQIRKEMIDTDAELMLETNELDNRLTNLELNDERETGIENK